MSRSGKIIADNLRTYIAFGLLFIGFLGLTVSILKWLPPEILDRADWVNYYSSLVTGFISFGFIVLFWQQIENLAKGDLPEDVALKVINEFGANHFEVINKLTSYAIAADAVKDAIRIRVIGYAQAIDGQKHEANIQQYLDDTINRLTEKKNIIYQRICSSDLSKVPVFKEHISKCIKAVTDRSHKFELIFINEFQPPYTCLIIDGKKEKLYLLILNQYGQEAEEPCFMTRDKKIIKHLETHFDFLWQEYKGKYAYIQTEEEFEELINKNSIVKESLTRINTEYIKNKKLGRIREYIERSFKELSEHLKDIEKKKIEINHTSSTSSLLNAFSIYIKQTRSGDIYYVITTIDVWKKVMHEDEREHEFKNANTSALKKGVEMNRILILDYNLIPDKLENHPVDKKSVDIYYKYYQIREILSLHFSWLKKYPEDYKFKIYFMEDYNEKVNSVTNFTLIKYANGESVLFNPQKDENQYTTKTLIEFDSSRVAQKEDDFEDLISKINIQTIEHKHIKLLKEVSHSFFNTEEKLKKVIGSNYKLK